MQFFNNYHRGTVMNLIARPMIVAMAVIVIPFQARADNGIGNIDWCIGGGLIVQNNIRPKNYPVSMPNSFEGIYSVKVNGFSEDEYIYILGLGLERLSYNDHNITYSHDRLHLNILAIPLEIGGLFRFPNTSSYSGLILGYRVIPVDFFMQTHKYVDSFHFSTMYDKWTIGGGPFIGLLVQIGNSLILYGTANRMYAHIEGGEISGDTTTGYGQLIKEHLESIEEATIEGSFFKLELCFLLR